MLHQVNQAVVEADETLLATIWQRIQLQLEAEKQRIFQEIRHYPPPIPACDVQFNGLLEERATILQELGRVNGIRKQSLSASEQIVLMDELIRSSRYLKSDLAENIRQSLTGLAG
jgi:hypothetical protein